MKISYDWLSNLIDLDPDPNKVSALLTNTGLEVEHLDEIELIKGGLKGLVIGQVMTCSKHPNADKLKITTVDIGADENLQIVCGAPNVSEGQKVVIAPVNSVLHPVGHEPFTIKKAKIRGEHSHGMICAEDEIGLGTDHDGIIVLPDTAPIGGSVSDFYNVKSDHVIEIGLTPNRGDAISHFGVARDIKAVTGNSIRFPKIFNSDTQGRGNLKIKVDSPELCPRYCGILLTDLKIGPSPEWMQNHLRSIDQNPINNVVDITNYVLHELGQPIHAFDWDKVKGGITVREAKPGERLVTLDNEERKFQGGELLICDDSKALAIGGVYGGLDSGVSDSSVNIMIESAYFDPGSIRKTARQFGLNTDASFRFERGTDPDMVEKALRRVVQLLVEYADAKVDSSIVDIYPEKRSSFQFEIDIAWLNSFCGTQLNRKEIKSILEALDIACIDTEGGFDLKVPPYRVDVTRPVDIAEEVLRIYGYNNVEIPTRLSMTPAIGGTFSAYAIQNRVANLLSDNGFLEIMNNSQTSADRVEGEDAVALLNPLSREYSHMRTELLSGLTNALSYNWKRKSEDLKFYEFGKIYKNADGHYTEERQLIIGGTGLVTSKNWISSDMQFDHYFVKSTVELIFNSCGISLDKMSRLVQFGVKRASELKNDDINSDLNFAVINWDGFIKASRRAKFKLQAIPKYPLVKRDLSAVIDTSVHFQNVEEIVRKACKKYFRGINCFDVYEGDKLGKGKKAYAFSIFLYDEQKTMNDKQIDGLLNQTIAVLEKEIGALIRR